MASEPDWEAVRDKRMSELTPEQQEDALELWLRQQHGWMQPASSLHDGRSHVKFLLDRLDAARGVK